MDEDRPPDSPPPGFERHEGAPPGGFEGPAGASPTLPPAPIQVPPQPDLPARPPPPLPGPAPDPPDPDREMKIGEAPHAGIKPFPPDLKALMAIVAFVVVPFTFLQQYAVRETGP